MLGFQVGGYDKGEQFFDGDEPLGAHEVLVGEAGPATGRVTLAQFHKKLLAVRIRVDRVHLEHLDIIEVGLFEALSHGLEPVNYGSVLVESEGPPESAGGVPLQHDVGELVLGGRQVVANPQEAYNVIDIVVFNSTGGAFSTSV